jgi:hypothetical protein
MRTAVATENYRSGKLYLKSPFFLKRIRRIYQFTFATSLMTCALVSYYYHLSLLASAICMMIVIALSFILYQGLKKIVTGSIHGDYLIVTHRLTNKSKVVDVRHLRSIRSVRFLWLSGTKFTYNLDGEIKRVILLCSGSENRNVTDYLRELKKAA